MAEQPTADDLARQAAEQLAAAPVPGTQPPPESDVAARLAASPSASPAGLTESNVARIMATIQALQSRIDTMEEERAAGNVPPIVATADAARDLLKVHAAHNPKTDHAAVLGLADDLADAAANAEESGDGTELAKIGTRLERAIRKIHPGPGDHHYLNQALGLIRDHLPEAAEKLEPRPKRAPAAGIGSSQPPAKVVTGSVTG